MSATAAHRASVPLDSAPLEAVLALSDEIGVLSIYADADPALWAGPRPAWQTPVRVGLRGVLEQARSEWPRAERAALEARLDELRPELDDLLDPRGRGRGRALFASIVTGAVERLELRMPFPPSVTLDRHPRILPLLTTLQAGRPAGVVCVTSRLEVYEWAGGAIATLETLDLASAAEPARGWPCVTNPSVRQPALERDRFEAAAEARILARVRWTTQRLERLARDRQWDAIVVDGEPRLVQEVERSLGANGITLVPSLQPLLGVGAVDVATRAGATLQKMRATQAKQLAAQLRTSPLATGGGTAVATALAHGRVERLLLNASAADPVQIEELVRRAVATAAEITLLAPPARELGSDGTAALRRW